MTDKSLQDKAINIKGKEYVQVKDRIIFFNENYPNGMIQTQIVSDNGRVVMKAKVTPDAKNPDRYFTGISASNPDKSIESQVPHEVAETSAVGRALAMMGIGVIDSVASVDEMHKAGASKSSPSTQYDVYCQYHNVKMFKTPRMRTHAHKDDQMGWCDGSGYPDEKQAHREKINQKPQVEESAYDSEDVAEDVPF